MLDIQTVIIISLVSVLNVLILIAGYLMGRKTKTDEPVYTPKFNPGSTDEPEGDIIADHLYEDEEEERKPTI